MISEGQVLAYFWRARDTELMSWVREADFNAEASRRLFRVLLSALVSAGTFPSLEALVNLFHSEPPPFEASEFFAVAQKLFEEFALAREWTDADLEVIRPRVVEWVRSKRAHQLAVSIPKLSQSQKYEEIAKRAAELASIGTRTSVYDYRDSVSERVEYWDAIRASRKVELPVSLLNRALLGGVLPGELTVISAAPKVGKSYFLLWLAGLAMARGLHPLHITLEMSKEEVSVRLDTYFLNRWARTVSPNFLFTLSQNGSGGMSVFDALKHYNVATILKQLNVTGSLTILDFSATPVTLSALSTWVEKVRLKSKVDLVLIDYGNLIRTERPVDNLYATGAEVFSGLHRLAKRLDLPVFVVARANREALKKTRIDEVNIGESYAILYDLDFFIGLNLLGRYGSRAVVESCLIYARRGPAPVSDFFEVNYASVTFEPLTREEANLRAEELRKADEAERGEKKEEKKGQPREPVDRHNTPVTPCGD